MTVRDGTKLAKGFKCRKCKTYHRFPPYVYAHWDMVITHTCDCGAKHDILRGRTMLVKEQT